MAEEGSFLRSFVSTLSPLNTGYCPMTNKRREASYYRFIGHQTDGRPSLDTPGGATRSWSRYVLATAETVHLTTTHPSQPLDHYHAPMTLGLFSERTAPAVRELIGEGLVERPVSVDGRPYHFFLTAPAVHALDLDRSEVRRFPDDGRISCILQYVFIDNVVDKAPRMFRLGEIVAHSAVVNAAGARVIRALKITGSTLAPIC